ncbi:hypothetical protein C2G38_2070931, partial [Gigaspora rosea]
MVKILKILAFLILIFHVHLTTTLPNHVLEERNLLANRSGHDLKKRDSNKLIFDPLNLKGTIIRRPADVPIQMALIGLAASCEKLKTFLAFCLCCAFNNYDTVIDGRREVQLSLWDKFKLWLNPSTPFQQDLPESLALHPEIPIRGPSLRDMLREYQASEYYNFEMGSSSNSQLPIPDCPTSEAIPDYNSQQQLTPCIPQTVDDIVRPLDPSTSETCKQDPEIPESSTSQASTSQPVCRIPFPNREERPVEYYQRRRDRLLGVNPPGFAEFLEVLTRASVMNDNPQTQLNLWRDYNRVRERFALFIDVDVYLLAIQRYAKELERSVNQLQHQNFGLNHLDDEDMEELVMYCSWKVERDRKKDEL